MGSNEDMERRLALVIVVDGLRASALGTYGNTIYPTPLFDELASRSLVVEWLLNTGPTLSDFYQGAFSGLETSGMNRLLTDDTSIIAAANNSLFAEVLATEPGVEISSGEIAATHAAAFFAHAADRLASWQQNSQRNGLQWIHFSGLSGPWDAPLAMRQDLLDEDDPRPPEFVVSPTNLRQIDDPDQLLGYRVAYAAQVAVIESCLAGMIEAFDELPFEGKKLAMIVGARGFALGEHRFVGHDCQSLYSEQLHLPWLILADEAHDPLPRAIGFAQPADIGTTLSHWLRRATPSAPLGHSLVPFLSSQPGRLRDAVIALSTSGESMIRTPAWQMRQADSIELYAKPDDRWEANDVANRCPDIVEQLGRHFETIHSGLHEPIAHELISPWR